MACPEPPYGGWSATNGHLPRNPTLVFDRNGDVPLSVTATSAGRDVRTRQTVLGGFVRVDFEIESGEMDVYVRPGERASDEHLQFVIADDATHGRVWLTDAQVDTDALLLRIEEAGRVTEWFRLDRFGGLESDIAARASWGAHFRVVGLFVDGRIETVYDSVYLGPDVPCFAFTAGMPVSERGFAALVLCVALALIDFRRLVPRRRGRRASGSGAAPK